MQPLTEAQIANFNTLLRAARDGNLALVQTKIVQTGETVAALMAIAKDGEQYIMTPFAHMPNANPYEFYEEP